MVVTIFIITGFRGASTTTNYDRALNPVQDLHSGIKRY